MTDLSHVESLVVNETLDDAENLEQIYRSLMPQAAPPSHPESPGGKHTYSETASQVTLAELADAIRSLVERGLLIVHHDPAEPPANDLSYVWRCWFEAGAAAREIHQRSSRVNLRSARS